MRGGILIIACVVAANLTIGAQSVPRTADGRPDLDGIWYFGTATPLERPKDLEGKSHFVNAADAADFERRTAERIAQGVTVHPPDWLDYGTKVVPDLRTSLIVDPPDGRVPPLTPEARARQAARRTPRGGPDDDPEARSLTERCLMFGAGPPLVPGPYNNNLQIVQTPGNVVLFSEMIHDARIVPLDSREKLPDSVKQWLGVSRGRWEGDVLVVETTNFDDHISLRGSDERLRVIERFTLQSPDALRYEYTVDNPTAFTKPWSAAYTMTRSRETVYEYACHEGNYGLMNILRGARAEEQAKTSGGPASR